MARIRSIKPEAFHSESLSQCSVEAERTFWGMSTLADDQGRLRDQPAVINGALWCLRPQHTAEAVDDEISQLVTAGALCRYVADGKHLIHFPTWDEHQKISHPSKSRLGACPKHEPPPDTPASSGVPPEASGALQRIAGTLQPDLGKGKGKGGGTREGVRLTAAPDAPGPSPPNGRRRTIPARTPDLTRFGTAL